MDKVIDIQERLDRQRQGRQVREHRNKIQALQRVLQCTSCQFRCAVCGHHLNEAPDAPGPLGYVFCDSCRGEFEAFLEISSGESSPDVFWHNEAWLEMWSAWLDYQQAIHRFMHSREFMKLVLPKAEKQKPHKLMIK